MLILISASWLGAQDSHYWTNQYGTEAQLLGGLVVGSVSDLSSTYYNPGAISLTHDDRLILGTDGVELIYLQLKNPNSSVKTPNSFQTRPTPSIFAYRFLSDSLQKNHFAISYLTRRNSNFKFEGARVGYYDIVDKWPGTEFVSADFYSNNSVNDTWLGVSYSRRITNKVGLGITQYVAIRSQQHRNQVLAQGVNGDNLGQSVNLIDRWNYTHARILWKIGLVYVMEEFSFGLSIKTPSLDILGSGTSFFQIADFENNSSPILLSTYGDEMDVFYKEPFSIAIGMTYKMRSSRLYFTLEYFNQQSEFTVMDLPPLKDAASSIHLENEIRHKMARVINFGLGLEQVMSDNISLYLSFLTDNSGIPPGINSDISFSRYNIYHLAAGSKFTLFNFKLTLGLSFGFGSNEIQQDLYYPNSALLLDLGYEKITYNSLRLLLGISTSL
jgi:hypothetical protein